MGAYKRVMLKLSGEALGGESGQGFDPKILNDLAVEVQGLIRNSFEVAIVIGGGNFLRGAEITAIGVERGTGDYMGMLATLMNALALQSVIEGHGCPTRVLSALPIPLVSESYIRRRALRHMEKGRVVILAGGTGNPYFTTDTAAALRAVELGCDVFLKGTKVDGIYTADPKKDPNARKYDTLTYDTCLKENLKVMDATAFTMCRENRLPILVFSMAQKGAVLQAALGEKIGTIVTAADQPVES